MLGLLVRDDEAARELLLARIAEGDNDALAALGDVRQLNPEIARRLAAQDAQLLDDIIAQAQRGAFAVSRTRDPASRLAILGVHFPEVAPWDALLRYLADVHMPSEHKPKACLALAAHADRLPASLRSDLRELLPHLTGTVPADKLFGSPLGGAAVILAAAVGALDDQTLTSGLAALLTGSRQERLAAATLISRLGRHELTAALVTLVNDPYPDVRAEAARALATRVASSDIGIDPLASPAGNEHSPIQERWSPWRSPPSSTPPKRPATKPANSSLRFSTIPRHLSAKPPPAHSKADAGQFRSPGSARLDPPSRTCMLRIRAGQGPVSRVAGR
jgi:hypothetical protein